MAENKSTPIMGKIQDCIRSETVILSPLLGI